MAQLTNPSKQPAKLTLIVPAGATITSDDDQVIGQLTAAGLTARKATTTAKKSPAKKPAKKATAKK